MIEVTYGEDGSDGLQNVSSWVINISLEKSESLSSYNPVKIHKKVMKLHYLVSTNFARPAGSTLKYPFRNGEQPKAFQGLFACLYVFLTRKVGHLMKGIKAGHFCTFGYHKLSNNKHVNVYLPY